MPILRKPEQFQANVLVVPLFADRSTAFQREVLTARQALRQGTLRILESSSVQRLIVEITDNVVVLLPEHEILEGGGQNRTPAGSFLLGQGRHDVPAFCVERGRWNPEPEQTFQNMAFQLPLEVRRAKLRAHLSSLPPTGSGSFLSYEQLREELIRFLRSRDFRRAEEVADFILEHSMDYLRNQGIQDLQSLPRYLPEVPDAWLHDVAVVRGVRIELQTSGDRENFMEREESVRRLARQVMGFLRDLVGQREPAASRGDAQTQVWEAVSRVLREGGVQSRSENVGDFYRKREDRLQSAQKLLRLFPPLPDQCGVMVFVGGHLRGIEWVASPQVWRSYHESLLMSYFTDSSAHREPVPIAWQEVDHILDALQHQLETIPDAGASARGGIGTSRYFPLAASNLFSGAGEALFYEGQPYAVSVLALE